MSTPAVAERGGKPATAEDQQLVTMMVDGQHFGIPILRVQDIVEPDRITPVPNAPSAIAGVLNLRGRIVTVIDLRECLNSPPIENHSKLISVTVEHKGDLYTLLVDSIGDVQTVNSATFGKPPATLDAGMRRLCSGVYRLDDTLLAVLDVDKVLDEEFLAEMPKRSRRRLHTGRNRLDATNMAGALSATSETAEAESGGKSAKGGGESNASQAEADAAFSAARSGD